MLLELISRRMNGRNRTGDDCEASLAIEGPAHTTLRLVEYEPKPVKSREKVRRAARKSASLGGRAFLLHPDSATRSQFDRVLPTLGLTAVDFDDETELTRAIDLDQPEIVLWGMPGCSRENLDRIREVTRGRCLPVVVVASLGDEVTLEQAHDAGACDLLFLPLPCHRLAPALTIALLRHEILELLADEHEGEDNRSAARNLAWRAAKVWSKRRGATLAEALRHILIRSRAEGHTLTRTAMEVVAEGLFP